MVAPLFGTFFSKHILNLFASSQWIVSHNLYLKFQITVRFRFHSSRWCMACFFCIIARQLCRHSVLSLAQTLPVLKCRVSLASSDAHLLGSAQAFAVQVIFLMCVPAKTVLSTCTPFNSWNDVIDCQLFLRFLNTSHKMLSLHLIIFQLNEFLNFVANL